MDSTTKIRRVAAYALQVFVKRPAGHSVLSARLGGTLQSEQLCAHLAKVGSTQIGATESAFPVILESGVGQHFLVNLAQPDFLKRRMNNAWSAVKESTPESAPAHVSTVFPGKLARFGPPLAPRVV